MSELLTYKGRPLMRKDNLIYYGSMADKYIVMLQVLETKKLIAKTARKYGKFAGTVGGPGNQDDLIAMGYNFISLGADVVALANYFKGIVETCTGKDAVMP